MAVKIKGTLASTNPGCVDGLADIPLLNGYMQRKRMSRQCEPRRPAISSVSDASYSKSALGSVDTTKDHGTNHPDPLAFAIVGSPNQLAQ